MLPRFSATPAVQLGVRRGNAATDLQQILATAKMAATGLLDGLATRSGSFSIYKVGGAYSRPSEAMKATQKLGQRVVRGSLTMAWGWTVRSLRITGNNGDEGPAAGDGRVLVGPGAGQATSTPWQHIFLCRCLLCFWRLSILRVCTRPTTAKLSYVSK